MVESDTAGIPTPNQWLESKLRDLDISNAGLARLIGRSRTEVQRWVNNREQIPRHHLAEIAAQLGTPQDLEYALKLKECEDFADHLRRRLHQLARIGQCDPAIIESATFELLQQKTNEECTASPSGYASVLLYNMTHASFVFRLWYEAAASREFGNILSPDNMKLQIQYPANHFFGLALNLGLLGGHMAEYREGGLAHLRTLATAKQDSPNQLANHHAIHILARFGSTADQELVTDLIENAVESTDLLSIRLGYAGLMLRPSHEHLAEKYVWLLRQDEALSFVDLLFDAVHYGDVALGSNREMPNKVDRFEKSLASIVRRLEQQGRTAVIQDLETFRLLSLMDRIGPAPFCDPQLISRLRLALETFSGDKGPYSKEARSRLVQLLNTRGLPQK
jgi:plasmid maintenance system antidote protein VapI